MEEESLSGEILLSKDLQKEILEFLQSHNDRLFNLVGKECS